MAIINTKKRTTTTKLSKMFLIWKEEQKKSKVSRSHTVIHFFFRSLHTGRMLFCLFFINFIFTEQIRCLIGSGSMNKFGVIFFNQLGKFYYVYTYKKRVSLIAHYFASFKIKMKVFCFLNVNLMIRHSHIYLSHLFTLRRV